MTVKRFVDKHYNNPQTVTGYENCRIKNMISTPEMETELVKDFMPAGIYNFMDLQIAGDPVTQNLR